MGVWTPHDFQTLGQQFMTWQLLYGSGGGGWFWDPGMGKTSASLSMINTMRMLGKVRRTLIVAPLRVVYDVWPDEIREWDNFAHLNYTIVHGDAASRQRQLAVPSDIHITNRDRLTWLAEYCKVRRVFPWDMVIFDESTSYKTWGSNRSHGARALAAMAKYRMILTGTPAPKGEIDLYPQLWLLDYGQRLGRNVTEFRANHCYEEGALFKPKLKESSVSAVTQAARELCLRLEVADYLHMPELKTHDVWVRMEDGMQDKYDEFERDMFVEEGEYSRLAQGGGAKYQICRQMANGGLYMDEGGSVVVQSDRKPVHLHNAKVDAALDIVEELNGKPALIAYLYDHDLLRLQKEFKRRRLGKLEVIRGGMHPEQVSKILYNWNNGGSAHIAVQPQALSYGVNMQKGLGRDVIWCGLPDSLEIIQQFNKRIWRQGVDSEVRVHRVMARNTVDEMVLRRMDGRDRVQADFLDDLREYAKSKYGKDYFQTAATAA